MIKQLLYIALFISIIGLSGESKAQDVYKTQLGKMKITTVVNDTVMLLRTNELLITLFYEKAKFIMRMDKSTFFTGVDSLDKQLQLMTLDIVELKGKFDLKYIHTKSHPPLDFIVEGVLSTTGQAIFGTGHLEHIADGSLVSCLLTMEFHLTKDQLGLDLGKLNIKDEIQIEVFQTLLNPVIN